VAHSRTKVEQDSSTACPITADCHPAMWTECRDHGCPISDMFDWNLGILFWQSFLCFTSGSITIGNITTTKSNNVHSQPFHSVTPHAHCVTHVTFHVSQSSTVFQRSDCRQRSSYGQAALVRLIKKLCAFYGTRRFKINGLWQTTSCSSVSM
jgi:hypothetical protein